MQLQLDVKWAKLLDFYISANNASFSSPTVIKFTVYLTDVKLGADTWITETAPKGCLKVFTFAKVCAFKNIVNIIL